MSIPFGPRLIGEAEKSLNALLRRALEGTGLDEPHWVALKLAGSATSHDGPLADLITSRAHFDDAPELVAELQRRGLLVDGRITAGGTELITRVQNRIAEMNGDLWDIDPDDVAAAERTLNLVATRARELLTA